MSERILRHRQEEAQYELDCLSEDVGSGADAMLARTGGVSEYPTTANVFYPVYPVVLSGDETEGTTPTISGDTSMLMSAFNAGSAVVPLNTYVIAYAVGGRWVFIYDG